VWRTTGDTTWTYWDLWFALLCLVDHDGSWDGLDEAIAARHERVGRWDGEAKWSHLLDLRARLERAGLTAGELVAGTIPDRKLVTRARTKVIKQGLQGRDLTPAMRDTPSHRLETRARFGRWPRFPISPQRPFDQLVRLFGLTDLDRYSGDGWTTRSLAHDLADGARSPRQRSARPSSMRNGPSSSALTRMRSPKPRRRWT